MNQANRVGADPSRRPVPCAYCGAPAGNTTLQTGDDEPLRPACYFCSSKFLRGELMPSPCEPIESEGSNDA